MVACETLQVSLAHFLHETFGTPICAHVCMLCYAHTLLLMSYIYYQHIYNFWCRSFSHLASEWAEEAASIVETPAALLAPSCSRLLLPKMALFSKKTVSLPLMTYICTYNRLNKCSIILVNIDDWIRNSQVCFHTFSAQNLWYPCVCARVCVCISCCVHTVLLMSDTTYIYIIAGVIHLLTLHLSEKKRQPASWKL